MRVIIVGAGIAGLTLADKLSDQGLTPVIIEREEQIGGLARSFKYDNGGIFDIGPHRFHTDDKDVQKFILDTLADDHILISRNSQLFLNGKYLPWPMTLKNIFALPPTMLVTAFFDLFVRQKAKTESFEDYIIENYGKTLYKAFFQPYTEKFVNYTCSNIHCDWATTGINRATIDKKVNTSSLISLIQSVVFSENPDTKFIYPKSGGIGVFCDILGEKIKAKGGRILTSTEISTLIKNNKNRIEKVVTSDGEEIEADFIFWSASIESLRKIGDAPPALPRVHYLSAVYYNYFIDHQIDQEFQWCYFGSKDMEIDRISVPRHFNPICTPEGKEGLCVEICCEQDSHIWQDPTWADCIVETFLLKSGLIKKLSSVEEFYFEKIRETYPLYALNYPRKLQKNFCWVNETLKNLVLIGRTGRFWYNNMDHSIAASLQLAKKFLEDYAKGDIQDGNKYSFEDRYLEG